jgi:hypothetical protein
LLVPVPGSCSDDAQNQFAIELFFFEVYVIEELIFRPGRIDPHIGIVVKTPKPMYMAILAPKIIDLNSGTLLDMCKYLEHLEAI